MKKVWTGWLVKLVLVMMIPAVGIAGEEFTYENYNLEQEKAICKTRVTIGDVVDNRATIEQVTEDGSPGSNCPWNSVTKGVIDGNYATISYHQISADGQTDYSMERVGNKLIFKGKRKGKAMDQTLELKDMPYFYFEIVGLMGFLKSGVEELDFQVAILDKMELYDMSVEVESEDLYEQYNEVEVEGLEVVWGLKGMMRMFYEQTYWFRKGDKMFIEQQDPNKEGLIKRLKL